MISETKLLPWAIAEAAKLRTPERVQLAESHAKEREDLEARRVRLLDMYEVGAIARDEWRTRLEAVDTAIERLDEGERIVAVPPLDWTWPPEAVNAVLRAMWRWIELDEHMRPVLAEWTAPEWRSSGDDEETREPHGMGNRP